MPHETTAENPFLSIRPSDSNLTVSLHPLVLLTISDHITRHRVRGEAGPVVGALLGQQKGRETTIEHAFSSRAITGPNGEAILDESWFGDRLQQCMSYLECPINIDYLLTMK
jgi:COP9 signalosome complex subunit 6